MANQYRAVSQIRVGRAPDDDLVFQKDDVVSGLTKDQMVELWNAGVLTEVSEEEAAASDERDAKIADLEQQLAEARAAAAAAQVPQGDAPDTADDEVAEPTPAPEGTNAPTE
jgi:hypothetical protein